MQETRITAQDVREARDLLAPVTHVTPMLTSRRLCSLTGVAVHLKCENLQRTGSFKLRGAYVRIAGLDIEERARGVVAASAGNHAQGVALAASLLDARSTIFVPSGAPLPKLAATRDYGAAVRTAGTTVDEAMEAARRFSDETGAVFIHPFDHRDVITGQATVGAEILEQCPRVRTVLVGLGGGGLLAGIAAAVKLSRPHVKVVGVQALGAAAFPPSLAAGHPVTLEHMSTVADGLMVQRPGDLTFEMVKALGDGVVTVSEESLAKAVLLSLERLKLVVEPAGASSIAALLEHPNTFEGPVVAVLTGGNIDAELLQRFLRHDLASAGRRTRIRVQVADHADAMTKLHSCVSRANANVLDVERVDVDPGLDLTRIEVDVLLAIEGDDHRVAVIEELGKAGITVLPRQGR
ncbi:threonine ammonia-lyase [Embleya sp. NPDC127516]|uniref:threonine ammonia-lyase n=1 Tax=Embleya sp. NPDC127516 TaxID=3363990 RepID=UPI0038293E2E